MENANSISPEDVSQTGRSTEETLAEHQNRCCQKQLSYEALSLGNGAGNTGGCGRKTALLGLQILPNRCQKRASKQNFSGKQTLGLTI